MRFSTKVVKGNKKGVEMIPPLHLSTICSQEIPGQVRGFEYSRIENPTRTRVEKEIAFIEDAKHAILFSSGMAAITAVLSTLKAGDHIICSKNIYEGTMRVIENIFTKFLTKFEQNKRQSPFSLQTLPLRPFSSLDVELILKNTFRSGLNDVNNVSKLICQASFGSPEHIFMLLPSTFECG